MKTIDIRTFSTQLQDDLKLKLDAISQENKEIPSRASKSLAFIKSSLDELKAFVYQYEFQSKSEEVEFFKEIKPVLSSQYYYYERLLSLKIGEPSGDTSCLKTYYYNEMDQLRKYLMTHREFYAYCLSGSKDLDELYFVARKSAFLPPDIDSRFSTGHDTILAMILANQMIKEHLDGLIKNLNPDLIGTSPLTWTAKKAYLVELIYALHAVDAFNNGKAEIKQIANLFESLFNVSLGNFYRHFSEIGIRKSGQTNFIDQLKERLEQKMDEL